MFFPKGKILRKLGENFNTKISEIMKKYQIFLEKYLVIENENERLAFMRGYMLSLTPKQFQVFFDFNAKNGIAAIKELAKSDTLEPNSLDEIKALAQRLKHKFSLQLQAA
jgi:hypothetical protein